MGKVGSTSVWDALTELGLQPIQLHVLDADRISLLTQEHELRGFDVPDHIRDAVRVQSLIANPNEKFRIISLVRDPVARNLSALFETWDIYPPSYDEAGGPAKLAEWFVMNFDYSVLKWFDQEIKARAGIDVFEHPFDHGKKRLIIETERAKILIMRKEDSQAEKERNLRDFLEVPDVSLGYSNVTAKKGKSELWGDMIKGMKVSHTLADIVYGSELVRHFYSPAQMSALKQRWMPSRDGVYFEPDATFLIDQV